MRRERRILFDGRPAEIHPYDVTVERRGRGRGLGLQVGRARHQGRRAPPARRRAARRAADEARPAGRRSSCSTPGDRARSGSSGARPGRARGPQADRARGARPAGRPRRRMPASMTERPASRRRRRVAVPGPVRRGAARTACLRTSALLRYAQDVAWIHSERLGLRPRVVRRARPDVARARGGARGRSRRSRWGRRSTLSTDGRRLPQGLGAATDARRAWPTARSRCWAHTDWVIIDARGAADPRSRPSSRRCSARCPAPFEPGRVPLPPTPADAAVHRGSRSGRRTSTRWTTSTTPPTSTSSRRRSSPRRARPPRSRAIPRTVPHRVPAPAVPGGRRRRARAWRGEPATGDGAPAGPGD